MFSSLTDFYTAVRMKPTPGSGRCAGVAIQAADTGRVLMIQRALDPDDPAAGDWEFPGGHVEDSEDLRSGAVREWQEEVGVPLPMGGVWGQTWQTGCYTGHIYRVGCEAGVEINAADGVVLNPDNPDGDIIETACWHHPDDLPAMPSLREELRSIDWGIFSRSPEELALERLTGRLGKDNALAVLSRARQLAAPRATGSPPGTSCTFAEAEEDGRGHGRFLCQCGGVIRQCRCKHGPDNPARVYNVTDRLCEGCEGGAF